MRRYFWFATGLCFFSIHFNYFSNIKRAQAISEMNRRLFELQRNSVDSSGKKYYPIVYNNNYDISFYGFESLHNFDTHKWGKTHQILEKYFGGRFDTISPLGPIDREELSLHHTKNFVENIHNSNAMIANTAEIYYLRFVPNFILQKKLIEPFKWQTSGSILAASQAFIKGSAINLGGGFHHASSALSMGFCFFADISLIIKYFSENVDKNMKFMIIDLDAHQGNGHEQDKFLLLPNKRGNIYILDMYNSEIYPKEEIMKSMIDRKIEINSKTTNDDYISILKENIDAITQTIEELRPNLIIYNAGSDILIGDPLGHLNVDESNLIKRDEIVFDFAQKLKVPIVMLTSGGYQKTNANVISKSVINLIRKDLIKPIDKEDQEVAQNIFKDFEEKSNNDQIMSETLENENQEKSHFIDQGNLNTDTNVKQNCDKYLLDNNSIVSEDCDQKKTGRVECEDNIKSKI